MRRTIETERTAIDRKTVLACDNCGLDSPLGNDQMPKTWYRVEHAGWGWTVPEMHACTDTCLVTLFGGVMPSSEGARERSADRIRDALDCLPRALDGSQPFSMGQRAEVMLAIESLRAALAAASEGS